MIHLFKHKKDGKFDIALVVKGKFIVGSNQHYNRKSGCYNALKLILNQVGFGTPAHDVIYFQDDTDMKKYYIGLHQPKPTLQSKQGRPSKPYIPNKK
jgi:uncharacterized protein YegP (UPF0339 family)